MSIKGFVKMNREHRFFAVASLAVVLFGCANSASHKVIKTEQVGDTELSCSDIRTEKRKAQIIINGVEQDKADMTGADVVDGLLWFPFNVIAKQSNYSSATQAAEDRISYLTSLEIERGCKSGSVSREEDNLDKVATRQLLQINGLYKEGVLTRDEYLQKRAKILSTVASPMSEAEIREEQKKMGQYSYNVEKMAKQRGCNLTGGAALLSKSGPIELYQVGCLESDSIVVRCEYQNCSVLK